MVCDGYDLMVAVTCGECDLAEFFCERVKRAKGVRSIGDIHNNST